MSQDAGTSWHQVEYGPDDNAVYRNGFLYDGTDFANWALFGVDKLMRNGWHVDSTVPDYRSQDWWYRELSRAGSVSMLEQSQDNGSA